MGISSVSYLTKRGYHINFTDNGCRIRDGSGTLCRIAYESENLYILKATPVIPERAYISRSLEEITEDTDLDPIALQTAYVARYSKANLNTWHRRLGHIASDSVKRLRRFVYLVLKGSMHATQFQRKLIRRITGSSIGSRRTCLSMGTVTI